MQLITFDSHFPENIVTIMSGMGGIIYYPHPFIHLDVPDIIAYITRFRSHILTDTRFAGTNPDSLCIASCLTIRCKCQDLLSKLTRADLECIVDMQRQLKAYKHIFSQVKQLIHHDHTLTQSLKAKYVSVLTAVEKLECNAKLCAEARSHVEHYTTGETNTMISGFLTRIQHIFQKISSYAAGCQCPRSDQPRVTYKFRKSKKQKTVERKGEIPTSRSDDAGTNCFGSQVTFEVFCCNKLYVSKLFYNGSMQIPGGLKSNFEDIIVNLEWIIKYLRQNVAPESYIYTITGFMRNFTCSLVESRYIIRIEEFHQLLKEQKRVQDEAQLDEVALRTHNIGDYITYMNHNDNLTIELKRPYSNNLNKKITVNVKPCGKITIAGSRSELEAIEIYTWLNYMFGAYREHLLEDLLSLQVIPWHYDCSGGHELYDDAPIEQLKELDLI